MVKKKGGTPMEQPPCAHHWIIDNLDLGKCRKCGAVKDFRKLQAKKPNQFKLALRGTK